MAALDNDPVRSASPSPATGPGSGTDAFPPSADKADSGGFAPFGEDGFTFGDLLDIINPLQHIPIVSTAYRALTGDEISSASRVLGGTLFGGPIGAAVATANAVLDETTGRDAGEHVLALFQDDETGPPADTYLAGAAAKPVPDLAALAPLPGTAISLDFAALAPLPPETGAPIPAPDVLAVQTALLSAQAETTALHGTLRGTEPASRPEKNEPRGEDDATEAAKATEGWFAQSLLTALDKYEDAAQLGEITPRAISLAP